MIHRESQKASGEIVTDSRELNLSGERFTAVYELTGSAEEAAARAEDICLEQTVEFPRYLISREEIHEQIVGRVASIEPHHSVSNCFVATIEFPVEVAGDELPQLLNVLFGNISLKPGIRLARFDLPESLSSAYRGPRFGCDGLRKLVNVQDGPLLSTAIKPMGLPVAQLAQFAYDFALGGIDLIKDDHGLADQSFVRFEDRVSRISAAVQRANDQTGRRCLYLPNITGPHEEILRRARFARGVGAGGYLIAPGLAGWDAMRSVADDDECGLPIMSHPAFSGAFTTSSSAGIAHAALYGQINRLAGADAAIFPNYGGRFSFSQAECQDIVDGCARPMGQISAIFPTPAGGMTIERVVELCEFYGNNVILLIGGDLHRHGSDLVQSCRQFAELTRHH
jgi:ribulose-bisphosphate carboxylase large chain